MIPDDKFIRPKFNLIDIAVLLFLTSLVIFGSLTMPEGF